MPVHVCVYLFQTSIRGIAQSFLQYVQRTQYKFRCFVPCREVVLFWETESDYKKEEMNSQHLTLALQFHLLSPGFAQSLRLLHSRSFGFAVLGRAERALGLAVLGRAEGAHVRTGTSSVALRPTLLTTKTKFLVLNGKKETCR